MGKKERVPSPPSSDSGYGDEESFEEEREFDGENVVFSESDDSIQQVL